MPWKLGQTGLPGTLCPGPARRRRRSRPPGLTRAPENRYHSLRFRVMWGMSAQPLLALAGLRFVSRTLRPVGKANRITAFHTRDSKVRTMDSE